MSCLSSIPSPGIAPEGHTCPQKLQLYSQYQIWGISRGVNKPATPLSKKTGCNPLVGHAFVHRPQRRHFASNSSSSRTPGGRITLLQVASELGRALRRDGKLEESLSVLDDVVGEARRLGLESVRAVAEFYRAQTLLESDDREAAKEAALDAREMAQSMGERELLLRCRCLLARTTRGDSDSAENAVCCLDEAVGLLKWRRQFLDRLIGGSPASDGEGFGELLDEVLALGRAGYEAGGGSK